MKKRIISTRSKKKFAVSPPVASPKPELKPINGRPPSFVQSLASFASSNERKVAKVVSTRERARARRSEMLANAPPLPPPAPLRVLVEPDLGSRPSPRRAWSNTISVVTPVRNAVHYIERYCRSMMCQDVDFRCVVIDDQSTDGTYEIARRLIGRDRRFQLVRNGTRRGALANIIAGIKRLRLHPSAIIATVDGDDWLAHSGSLSTVLRTYEERPQLRLTYGQFIHAASMAIGFCKPYADQISTKRIYRRHTWFASHLRSFRAELWNKIDPSDLVDPDTGKPWAMAWDLGMMFPMLEMCRPEEIGFIPETIYVYNDVNALNDNRVDPKLQNAIEHKIRKMRPYPLTSS